jgi:hypothetical protein
MAIPLHIHQAHGFEGVTTDPPYHLVGHFLTEAAVSGPWICRDVLPQIEAYARGEIASLAPISTELLYLEFTKDYVQISEGDITTTDPPNRVPLLEFVETLRDWCRHLGGTQQ